MYTRWALHAVFVLLSFSLLAGCDSDPFAESSAPAPKPGLLESTSYSGARAIRTELRALDQNIDHFVETPSSIDYTGKEEDPDVTRKIIRGQIETLRKQLRRTSGGQSKPSDSVAETPTTRYSAWSLRTRNMVQGDRDGTVNFLISTRVAFSENDVFDMSQETDIRVKNKFGDTVFETTRYRRKISGSVIPSILETYTVGCYNLSAENATVHEAQEHDFGFLADDKRRWTAAFATCGPETP